jgi:hypothetical protein
VGIEEKPIMSLAYPARLLLAVLGYVAIYLLSVGADWTYRAPRTGRLVQVVESARLWGSRAWLNDMLRIVYYLLGPYLVLSLGWASPLNLGLADLDWVAGVGFTLAIGFGGLLLLLLLWWQYVRLLGDRVAMQQALWLDLPQGWAFALREAILLESWWAFLRSPMLLQVGPFWGVYLGLALAFMVGMLNPRTRYELGTPGLREDVILTASLAVLTATMYVFTHNLWLCIALHFVSRIAVLQLVHHSITRRQSAETMPRA